MILYCAQNWTNFFLEHAIITTDDTVLCFELDQLTFGKCDDIYRWYCTVLHPEQIIIWNMRLYLWMILYCASKLNQLLFSICDYNYRWYCTVLNTEQIIIWNMRWWLKMILYCAWNWTNYYLEHAIISTDDTVLCMELNQLLFGTCDYIYRWYCTVLRIESVNIWKMRWWLQMILYCAWKWAYHHFEHRMIFVLRIYSVIIYSIWWYIIMIV